jgi:two-component system heavy metal sensor histidine kinase CusS
MTSRSLALRLGLAVTVLGLLLAAGVLLFTYRVLERELDAQRRAVLRDKADQARHLLADMEDANAVRDNAFRLVELVTGHAELHLAVGAPNSAEAYVAFSHEAMASLERLKKDVFGTDAFLDWRIPNDGRRMLSIAAAAETRDARPLEIVITVDRSEDQRLLRNLLVTSATAAPFALALVLGSATLIVSLGLRPLKRLRETAAAISARSLSKRLDLREMPEELRAVGAAFNAMLDRLDDSVTRLGQFSSDLAHEMRTPLATLLGRTQVALSQPRTTEQLIDVLEGNVVELQRMSRLVSDMLFLAQAEDATSAIHASPLALHDEAAKVAEFLQLLAEERNISVVVQGSATIVADTGQVQRAITNLLSNAIRHCTPGTEVVVRIENRGEEVSLEVINQGDAIAPEHLGRLFDRFYRIDSARTRDLGGSGLGLAIVQTIMKLHGGRVEASCTPAGETRFTLHFPVVQKSAPG